MTETLVTSPAGAVRDPAPRSAPVAHVAFVRDLEPPAEFIRALRDVSPVSDAHGWLMPVWEPGETWAPAQRWMLYEMIHPTLVTPELLAELNGPHPRSEGHFCTENDTGEQFQCLCPHKTESWKGGPCQLTWLTQYLLYKKTGYVGYPFWMVQGERGGHKAFFSEEEQAMLAMEDLPTEPPFLGELPYAPLDGRVIAQVVRHNRLQQVAGDLRAYRKKMGADYAQHRAQVERDMRAQLVEYLHDGMREATELFLEAAHAGDLGVAPPTDIDYDRLEPQSTAHFIETGQQLHHTKVR